MYLFSENLIGETNIDAFMSKVNIILRTDENRNVIKTPLNNSVEYYYKNDEENKVCTIRIEEENRYEIFISVEKQVEDINLMKEALVTFRDRIFFESNHRIMYLAIDKSDSIKSILRSVGFNKVYKRHDGKILYDMENKKLIKREEIDKKMEEINKKLAIKIRSLIK